MTLPTTYLATLLAVILGALCLGSWINTLKFAKKWRFELFCFDFAIGALLAAGVAAFTLGTLGADGFTLMDDLMRAGKRNMAAGVAAGCVFNLGNMLMIGAMSLIGMSIAFPLSLGLALVISSVLVNVTRPHGNATLVFAGLASVTVAVVFALLAHRSLSLAKEFAKMKAGEHRTLQPKVSWKGVILALFASVPLSLFGPLLMRAKGGDAGVGPYSLLLLFSAGIAFSTFVYNLYFMNLPLQGKPVELLSYFRGRFQQHLLGILGGALWTAGALAFQVSYAAPENVMVTPSVSYALAQSAPVLTALWGVIVWKEFKDGGPRSFAYLAVMLFLLTAGLATLVAAGFSAAS